jgi:hypothetical protein
MQLRTFVVQKVMCWEGVIVLVGDMQGVLGVHLSEGLLRDLGGESQMSLSSGH